MMGVDWCNACLCWNSILAGQMYRYHNRIAGDDCTDDCVVPFASHCFGMGYCWSVYVIMRVMVNGATGGVTNESKRYLVDGFVSNGQ